MNKHDIRKLIIQNRYEQAFEALDQLTRSDTHLSNKLAAIHGRYNSYKDQRNTTGQDNLLELNQIRTALLDFLSELPNDPSESKDPQKSTAAPPYGPTSRWRNIIIGAVILALIPTLYLIISSLPSKHNWPKDWPQYPMITVEGGAFLMGGYEDDSDASNDEKPAHLVELPTYQIGQYEVTQELYEAIIGENPSKFKDCPTCPVEQVSWNDAQTFIQRLNDRTGANFRLPTEAEWEYAAGGGNQGHDPQSSRRQYIYAGSDNLSAVGWYLDNSGGKTQPVGKLQPNQLDIYDMSGNVREWCQDRYSPTYYSDTYRENTPIYMPTGPETGTHHVLPGGSWSSSAAYCRVSDRLGRTPNYRSHNMGFRLAHDP